MVFWFFSVFELLSAALDRLLCKAAILLAMALMTLFMFFCRGVCVVLLVVLFLLRPVAFVADLVFSPRRLR